MVVCWGHGMGNFGHTDVTTGEGKGKGTRLLLRSAKRVPRAAFPKRAGPGILSLRPVLGTCGDMCGLLRLLAGLG